jgi:hypothetical protein
MEGSRTVSSYNNNISNTPCFQYRAAHAIVTLWQKYCDGGRRVEVYVPRRIFAMSESEPGNSLIEKRRRQSSVLSTKHVVPPSKVGK